MIFVFSPLLVFLLTRNLTVAEFGVYSLFATSIAIFSVVLDLGLSQYMMTKLPSFKRKDQLVSFFSFLFFICLVVLLLILLVVFSPLEAWILSFLRIGSYVFEFRVVLLLIFFEAYFRIIISYFIALKKIGISSFLNVLRVCLWVLFLLVFLIFFRLSLASVVLLWISGGIVTFFSALVLLRADIIGFLRAKGWFNLSLIKNGLVFSLPLVPFIACGWVIDMGSRYFLNYYYGVSVVGIYSLCYALAVIPFSLSSVVSTVLYPYISGAWVRGNHQVLLNINLKYNLIVVVPAVVGLFVLREQVITLISGVDYLVGAAIIPILLFYPLFGAIINIFYQILLLKEKTRLLSLVYFVGAVLCVFLNFLLVPRFSMFGAAFSTVLSYFFLFFVLFWLCRKDLELDFRFIRLSRILAASLLMGVMIFFINPQVYLTKILSVLVGIIVYFAFLFLFRVFVKQEFSVMQSFLPGFVVKIFKK